MLATDGGQRFPLLEVVLGVVLVPLALAAWGALLTAAVGRFSPAVAVGVGGAGFIVVVALCLGWGKDRRWRRPSWVDGATLVVVVVAVWRLWPAATPWPTFLDASWYVNAGARIAEEGGLRWAPVVLEVGGGGTEARRTLVSTFADQREAGMNVPDDASRGFHDVAFAVPDVSQPFAVPYHPPFFSSWVALWVSGRGVLRAGGAVLPWAAAYLLAVAVLAKTVFGPRAALPAALLVAVGSVFVYYGRTPYAELSAGALALAGLVVLSSMDRDRAQPLAAAAGGLGVGLAVLAKADVALLLPAVAVWWLLARRGQGWREGGGLVVGLALPLGCAAVLALSVSELYVSLNWGGVLDLVLGQRVVVGVGVAVLVAVAVGGWLARRRGWARLSGVDARRGLALVVVAGAAVASAGAILSPDDTPPTAFAILAWAVTPLGLWAGVAGLVLSLEHGRRRAGPLVAVALVAVPIVLLSPTITETLSPLYTARRLVPHVLPMVAVFAGGLVVEAMRPRESRVYLGLALAGSALVLGSLLVASRTFQRVRDFDGGAYLAAQVAGHGGPDDVFVFATVLDGSSAGRMSAAVWNLERRATAVIAAPGIDLAPLSEAVAAWQVEGRRVFLVADSAETVPDIPGFDAQLVDESAIVTRAPAPVPKLPPRWSPLDLRLVVFELVEVDAPSSP